MRIPSRPATFRRQHGAALVIGLILLMVLTLLAVSGMNSASMEFVMAGNEQYRTNGFEAAEAGIEQSLAIGVFNPNNPLEIVPGAANGNDSWTATIIPQNNGADSQVWGFDPSSVLGLSHEITSTGTSTRARAINRQGVLQYVLRQNARNPDPNLPNQNLQ